MPACDGKQCKSAIMVTWDGGISQTSACTGAASKRSSDHGNEGVGGGDVRSKGGGCSCRAMGTREAPEWSLD